MKTFALLGALSALALASPALAKNDGHGNGKGHSMAAAKHGMARQDSRFSPRGIFGRRPGLLGQRQLLARRPQLRVQLPPGPRQEE